MKTRRLADMNVSALGLGCMGMSEFYGPSDDAESLGTLARAADEGVTLFDTADAYGFGHNEELLGRFLRGRQGQVRVAAKFGLVRTPGSYERRIDNSPAYIRSACEASLRRLGVETIDLYYAHRLDPAAPLEQTIGALARLVEEGKVRAIGLCEVSPATLRRAAALHPIAAVQSEYSLWTRDPEDGVLQACQELGAVFCAYSPLGRGFLTGSVDTASLAPGDFRTFNPRFTGAHGQANAHLADTARALAASKGCTPAQLALAWLLARGEHVLPIPGTRRIGRLLENLAALAVRLDSADLAAVAAAFPPGVANGERYSPEGMKGLNA